MVALQGAAESEPTLVTPWHPVFVAGNWTFPCRITNPCPLYMDCVYNLVLSSGHVITINSLQFITLGHGNDTHPVLAHTFFGTQAVVHAVRQRDSGRGVVGVNGFRRDHAGLVCGFADDEEHLHMHCKAFHSQRQHLQMSQECL